MKTRYKILIIIVILLVILGITGTTLIRNFFFPNRMQPDSYYTRAEAEYLLEYLNQGEVVFLEAARDSSSAYSSANSASGTDGGEADSALEGVTAADLKKAMQVILGLTQEQVEDLIIEQYESIHLQERAVLNSSDFENTYSENADSESVYMENKREQSSPFIRSEREAGGVEASESEGRESKAGESEARGSETGESEARGREVDESEVRERENSEVETSGGKAGDSGARYTEDKEIGSNVFACLYHAKDSDLVSADEFRKIYDYFIEVTEDSPVQKVSFLLLDFMELNSEGDTVTDSEAGSKRIMISPDCNYMLSAYSEEKNAELYEVMQQSVDQCVQVYAQENEILEYLGLSSDAVVLTNVWIESYAEAEQELSVFFYGYHKKYTCNSMAEDDDRQKLAQCLADIRLSSGVVTDIVLKSDVITAKVLSVDETEVELEGYGVLQVSDQYRIYKIYGELAAEPTSRILVGYNSANFVIADGVIEAALITEPIKAENIRVVLQNSDYSSLLHDSVKITSESAFTLSFQDQEKVFEAGEVLELTPMSGYMTDGRVKIYSDVENGKLKLLSLQRNGVNPEYRGTLEVVPYGDENLMIVNELSLEEYLYAVVPSEMPTSYGKVALEVQAICARGYAYMKMQDGSYAKYGAHVDDSTMTQVYNSVGESDATILAVKETYGMVPVYDSQVIQAYFFSTSCGTTCTNADVWDGEALPYLQDKMEGFPEAGIAVEGDLNETILEEAEAAQTEVDQNDTEVAKSEATPKGMTAFELGAIQEGAETARPDLPTIPADLSEEETFRSFIDDSSAYHSYEENYSLYRWRVEYTREEMREAIDRTLASRYDMNPGKVLTLTPDGSYISQPISSVGDVEEILVTKRGKSGIVKELKVIGTNAAVLIQGQSNIRALMTPVNVVIQRQDGTESVGWSMLPSPFYYVTVNAEGNYILSGGGFGHGVGMSQNGAKALADLGYSAEEIIQHYYTGVDIMNIYQ